MAVQSKWEDINMGKFTSYTYIARNKTAKINDDGSLNTTFNPRSGTDGTIYSISIKRDEKY